MFGFWGPKWAIFGVGEGFENCFEVPHVVEQLSFSIVPSILTFDFDLIGIGMLFKCKNWYRYR